MIKKYSLVLIALLCSFFYGFGQTTLTNGDIAIIGIDTPGEDFSFVTFVSLDPGTTIYFTDEEADNDYTIGTGEGTVLYTAPAGGAIAGEVISYIGNSADFTITSDGVITLSNNGDGIIAYQGSSVGNVDRFLHAVAENTATLGTFPGGFANYLLIGNDDGEYNGVRTGGNATSYLTAINNVANWTTSGSGVIPFDLTFFTFGATTYSVTYNGNGNTGGTAPTDSNLYNLNDSVIVLGNTGSLTNICNTFNNWNTAADGSGTSYSAGDTFNITANTTLHAQWSSTSCDVLMITQYYEGTGTNKWIEIKNISGAIVPANSFYIVILNNADADNPANANPTLFGSPSFNNYTLINSDMAIDEVRRFREPSAVLPAYSSPGETGYDGNPTYDMSNNAFSGDDIVIISSTNNSTTWNNRIDVIGDGTLWGDRRCFIRNECIANGPSITFDINDWIEFTDAEVENPIIGTNPYLGQHFEGVTVYDGIGPYSGWDNGLPDRSRIVEVSANYDTSVQGSFEACSLEINSSSTLDIKAGDYVSIVNDLTTNATSTLNVEHEGSLVMVDDSGVVTNNGTTNIYKTTSSMEEFDYLYWSSPVDYGNVTPFPTPIAFVLTDFNPTRIYEFNTANFDDIDDDYFDDNGNDWIYYDSDMKKGIGYAAMTSATGVRNAIFSGKVNNGVITVNVGLSNDANGDIDGDEDDWNLIGNPYPSAISADDFIAHNSNLSGTIYFWTHVDDISLSNPGPDAYNFTTDDYAMYNTTGGIGTGSTSGSNAPTGFIASGQGFFVDAITAGTIEFNNSMRSLSYANDDFFRSNNTTNEVEKDRIWLNLTNPDGAFSQILVGFFENATIGKDRIYDGVRLKGTNYLEFYSLDNTTLEYGIQGRPLFDITDNIKLGFESHIVGSLSIDLGAREGALLNRPVYLRDNYMMITHDLNISPYIFNTESGKFNDRFEIRFTEDILNLEEIKINSDSLQINELPNGDVQFKLTSPFEMKSIEIIDLLGRTLYLLEAQGNSQTFSLSNLSQATYLAKVKLSNGYVITKKALKRK